MVKISSYYEPGTKLLTENSVKHHESTALKALGLEQLYIVYKKSIDT